MTINRTTLFALLAAFGLLLAGCGDSGTEEPTGGGGGDDTPEVSAAPVPVPEATYEVGCAACTFGEDVPACATAAKIDGVVYLVEGEGVPDAMKTGLCKPDPTKAIVAGEVRDGKLHATKFVITK